MKLVMENWRKFLVENRDAELTDFIARTKEEFQLADLQLHIKKNLKFCYSWLACARQLSEHHKPF